MFGHLERSHPIKQACSYLSNKLILAGCEIGWGTWFRYFAGFVEITGALLILVPRLAMVDFAILGSGVRRQGPAQMACRHRCKDSVHRTRLSPGERLLRIVQLET